MLLNGNTPDGYTVDVNGLWRDGTGIKDSNVDITSTVNNTGSKYETGKTTGRAEERFSQELIDDIRDHAGASAYGGLH